MSVSLPGRQQWKALDSVFQACSQMEPSEFRKLYPGISRKQLARIAGCSIDTVDHWFMSGQNYRKPTEYHKLRLAIAHWIWTQDQSQPPVFEELRQIKREMDGDNE